jgi:hypothetical protein
VTAESLRFGALVMKKAAFLLLILLVPFCFAGCIGRVVGAIGDGMDKSRLAREISQNIMDCLIAEDEEALYSLFNQKARNFSMTREQIGEAFYFIDGEIVSYDLLTSGTGGGGQTIEGGRTTAEDWSPSIRNIVTASGKSYSITFFYTYIYEKDKSAEGLTGLVITMIEGNYGFHDYVSIGYDVDEVQAQVIRAEEAPDEREYVQEILQCLIYRDTHTLKNMFCRVTAQAEGFDRQLQEFWNFIDGEIVSYSIPKTDDRQGYEREWYSYFTKIRRVRTDTGKQYQIRIYYELKNEGYDDRIGISELRIENENKDGFIIGDFNSVKPDWPYDKAGYYYEGKYAITDGME